MFEQYPHQTGDTQLLRRGSWTSTQSLVLHPQRGTACACEAQLLPSNWEADLQSSLLHLTLLEQTQAENAWRRILHYSGDDFPSTASESPPFQNMSASKDSKAAADSAGCGGHRYKSNEKCCACGSHADPHSSSRVKVQPNVQKWALKNLFIFIELLERRCRKQIGHQDRVQRSCR